MFSANTSQVSGDRLYVEDVFSTYLYTGNGSTQTITNGIDLAGKGGLVWTKRRVNTTYGETYHILTDTIRGANKQLYSNGTDAQATNSNMITSFNADGYSIGSDGNVNFSGSGQTYASWTFREAPKFFDVVTYTGTGSTQRIAHSLGVTPGVIIIKRTSDVAGWRVWHRSYSSPATDALDLNTTSAVYNGDVYWGNAGVGATPDATTFSVGTNASTNASGSTYVAYLFAHDTTSDGIIQCGSYTGNGSSTGPTVTLGWEPQWLLVKGASGPAQWYLIDNMRGMALTGNGNSLYPNTSQSENQYWAANFININSTGFQVVNTDSEINASGSTYIYIAIRRGPMRTPTSGTSVYNDVLTTGTGSNSRIITGYGFNPDMLIFGPRSESGYNRRIWDRLRNTILYTDTTSSEASVGLYGISRADIQDGYVQGTSDASGYNQSGTTWANFGFRRAPSFLDEVCRPISSFSVNGNHNLGVAPEMIIGKRRDSNQNWFVYHTGLTGVNSQGKRNEQLLLNSDAAKTTAASDGYFVDGLTATSFETYWWPQSSGDAVLYFFASCPGVSKVGSYTGNGSSQTINCGFAAGARFVMIKRTDSTGDWYVWDSARGIVAGNDPRLSLNNTNAEVTTDDSVDTDSSGFVVNQLSATNINVSSATYIYLAVA